VACPAQAATSSTCHLPPRPRWQCARAKGPLHTQPQRSWCTPPMHSIPSCVGINWQGCCWSHKGLEEEEQCGQGMLLYCAPATGFPCCHNLPPTHQRQLLVDNSMLCQAGAAWCLLCRIPPAYILDCGPKQCKSRAPPDGDATGVTAGSPGGGRVCVGCVVCVRGVFVDAAA
jgi:hypothetical protein